MVRKQNKGSQDQSQSQKADLANAFRGSDLNVGTADYVLGWFSKGRRFVSDVGGTFGFVTTNSVHQGRQVGRFWPYILGQNLEIAFAEPSFRWTNLASKKAVVTVSIIGIRRKTNAKKKFYVQGTVRNVDVIGPYLVPNHLTIVYERNIPLSNLPHMSFGSMPNDSGFLLLTFEEAKEAIAKRHVAPDVVRPILGTSELTKGIQRYCLWLNQTTWAKVSSSEWLKRRIEGVREERARSKRKATQKLASTPHLFGEIRQVGDESVVIVSGVSSESRDFLPVAVRERGVIVSNLAFTILNAPLWSVSLIASRLHLVWIATVCGKMKTDFRYSNTLGWCTFPLPSLTHGQVAELTRCAEEILLAREHYFPATIADMYDPERLDAEFPLLRMAHEKNDETLERIYIGRRFKNDSERLEKLFDMYTRMTAAETSGQVGRKSGNLNESHTS